MSTPLQLILASSSPRRKDILSRAGFSFHVFSVKVSENLEKNLMIDEQIMRISRRKANASLLSYKPSKTEPFLMISADTMVILKGEPLGKPESASQAVDFLSRMSGEKHEVKTAITLVQGPGPGDLKINDLNLRHPELVYQEDIETSEVFFRPLSDKEIHEYVATGDPMDKAGAYGIQGQAQGFVEKIVGNYDNVMGLSLELFRRLLSQGKWNVKGY